MIADMSKYINALREKGRELFNSYLALKKHLEELKYTIDKLERENDQKKEVIAQVKGEMETWKGKARDLQAQVSTEFSLNTVDYRNSVSCKSELLEIVDKTLSTDFFLSFS